MNSGEVHFLSAGFALRGEALSLACPRESTQREGHPVHSSAHADALRSSPIRGRAQLGRQACLKQGARLIPDCLRYSVSADGPWGGGFEVHPPSGAAEHRSEDRIELASCLSESSPARSRVAQAPGFTRSTGNPRSGPASGFAFLLVLFFGDAKKSTGTLGQARESISPLRAKP